MLLDVVAFYGEWLEAQVTMFLGTRDFLPKWRWRIFIVWCQVRHWIRNEESEEVLAYGKANVRRC